MPRRAIASHHSTARNHRLCITRSFPKMISTKVDKTTTRIAELGIIKQIPQNDELECKIIANMTPIIPSINQ
jgi:hypothetical protein